MNEVVHVTSQGDTWDFIAKLYYGFEHYMTQIMDANPAYAGIVIFPAGVKLLLPEISDPAPEHLPPWMR